MFYNPALLTDKKSGLGVVWLAATLGAKSQVRKLQKRDILSVDVSKACAYLQQPPQPLALRMSSSLMVGVARVLDQQYAFFYMDVSQTHTKLKQQLVSMAAKDPESLEMPAKTRARVEAVTLQDDPFFDPEFSAQGTLDFLEHDIEELMTMDLSKDDNLSNLSVRSKSHSAGLPSGNSPSISIPGGLSSYSQPMLSLGRTGLGSLDLHGLVEEEGDILGPDGAGELLDFEFDALGQMQDKAPSADDLRTPSEKRSADTTEEASYGDVRARKKQRPSVDPLGVFDEQDEDRAQGVFAAYGGGFTPQPQGHSTPRPGMHDMPDMPEFGGDAMGFDFADDVPPTMQAVAPVTGKKRKRSTMLQIDSAIQIDSQTMVSWREGYEERMHEAKKRRRVRNSVLDAQAMQLVWGFHGALLHPDLKKLFCTPPAKEKRIAETTVNETMMPMYEDADVEMPRNDDFDGGVEPAQDEPADVELGLRAPSHDPFDAQLSLRQQSLPWNVSRTDRTPSLAGQDTAEMARGRQGSFGFGTPIPFSFMDQQGSLLGSGMRGSVRGSVRPGSRMSGLPGTGLGQVGEMDSFEMPVREQDNEAVYGDIQDFAGQDPTTGVSGGRISMQQQAVDTQMANESQFLLSTIQQESHNFLEYTRERIAQQAQDEDHDIDAAATQGKIKFEHLVSPATSDRFVAAQALSHVLLLASRGALKVEQQAAFGPIMLSSLVESV